MGDRTRQWRVIEGQHGEPTEHWVGLLLSLAERTSDERMAVLQGEQWYSRAHADAVVMYFQDSPASRRHDTLDACLAGAAPDPAARRQGVVVNTQTVRACGLGCGACPAARHGGRVHHAAVTAASSPSYSAMRCFSPASRG